MEKKLVKVDDTYVELVSTDQFGRYANKSEICPVCLRKDHNLVNLARARDHQTLDELEKTFGNSKKDLRRHFENHYVLSDVNQAIINSYENTDSKKREIITAVFEGTTDLIEASHSILKGYADRLVSIDARIKALTADLERDMLEPEDIMELQNWHKLYNTMSKEMLKAYEIIDKKIFPPNPNELWEAVTTYKLDVLEKLLNYIAYEFHSLEKKGEDYSTIIKELREALSIRFNKMQEEVWRSGGHLRAKEVTEEITESSVTEDEN